MKISLYKVYVCSFSSCFIRPSHTHFHDPPFGLRRDWPTWCFSYCLFDQEWCPRSSASTYLNTPKNVKDIRAVLEGSKKKIEKRDLCSRSNGSSENRNVKRVSVKCTMVSVRLSQQMVQITLVFTFRHKGVLAFANSAHNFLYAARARSNESPLWTLTVLEALELCVWSF